MQKELFLHSVSKSMAKFLFTFVLLFFVQYSSGQIKGRVTNADGKALPAALLLALPDSIFTLTDLNGEFELNLPRPGQYQLFVQYVGYRDTMISLTFEAEDRLNLDIRMTESVGLIEEVLIVDEHSKQESSLSATHLTGDNVREELGSTFSESIDHIPGVRSLNSGVGVASPLIRGMGAKRFAFTYKGIKQESQQWGMDHGLAIDPFDAGEIELIKGPASLQYGSDAIAGLLKVAPPSIPNENTLNTQIDLIGKTNNRHLGYSLFAGLNRNNFFLLVRYGQQSFSDFRTPANRFTYNGFDLPLYDGYVNNSAGRENSFSLSAGRMFKKAVLRMNYSWYYAQTGMFSGAVGIPRAYNLEQESDRRDIALPRRFNRHENLSLNYNKSFKKGHFDLNLGWQRNNRREASRPDFHSVSVDSSLADPNLAIGMELHTLSFNTHIEKEMDQFRIVVGANAQQQRNERAGFEYFVPDFKLWRSGLFGIAHLKRGARMEWSIGMRFDYGNNASEAFKRYVFNARGALTDSLEMIGQNRVFYNWSSAIGLNLALAEGGSLKFHLARSFRIPHPSETSSNGVHHGSFRHERGAPELTSEQGYQIDISLDKEWECTQISAAAFTGYFNNFIYLGPSVPAKFSRLPEAGQLFTYQQNDMLTFGFELGVKQELARGIEWNFTGDYVQRRNLRTAYSIPFTPPPAMRNGITVMVSDYLGIKQKLKIGVEHEWVSAARSYWRTDQTEWKTPGYQLLNLSGQFKFRRCTVNLGVSNLLNTAYLKHISRYRLLNLYEQGRNVVLVISVPISSSLD